MRTEVVWGDWNTGGGDLEFDSERMLRDRSERGASLARPLLIASSPASQATNAGLPVTIANAASTAISANSLQQNSLMPLLLLIGLAAMLLLKR